MYEAVLLALLPDVSTPVPTELIGEKLPVLPIRYSKALEKPVSVSPALLLRTVPVRLSVCPTASVPPYVKLFALRLTGFVSEHEALPPPF